MLPIKAKAALDKIRAASLRVGGEISPDAAAECVAEWVHGLTGVRLSTSLVLSVSEARRAAADAKSARLAAQANVKWADVSTCKRLFKAVNVSLRADSWSGTTTWPTWKREISRRMPGHTAIRWDVSPLIQQLHSAVQAEDEPLFQKWLPIAHALHHGAHCFWVGGDTIHVALRPRKATTDDQNRLHNERGPAFIWNSEMPEYWWHGVRVTERDVLRPESITAGEIRLARNVEYRRVLVERYGYDRYVRDMGGKRLNHQEGIGTLWSCQGVEEEIRVVEVVNSTPEPDGSWKRYWLRVPPDVTSARQAVAWTFSVPVARYRPHVET